MKIILVTDQPESPSFQFYYKIMSSLHLYGCNFQKANSNLEVNYNLYDIVLFMGGSNSASYAKAINKKILCGIVDPRSLKSDEFKDIDFIIANGIESKIFFSIKNLPCIIYPTYPIVSLSKNNEKKENEFLVLGYHGNKLHLEGMMPRITSAIQKIQKNIPVHLIAMYDIAGLGKSQIITTSNLGFKVNHIQFSYDNFVNYISKCDIGLVPQLLTPQNNVGFLKKIFSKSRVDRNNSDVNYNLNFKCTTNLGRHFVFCQYKIPIITDITPSVCTFVDHGKSGYICYSSDSWYLALQALATDKDKRKKFGEKIYNKWQQNYTPEELNKNLISELNILKSKNHNHSDS